MSNQFTIRWRACNPSVGPIYYKGYVGNWPVFMIKRAMTKDYLGEYILSDCLPGLDKQERHVTVELAKHAANVRLEFWIDKAQGVSISK